MKEAVLYKKLKGKKVQCQACAHRCIISEGKTGICEVRKNLNGKLYSLVYGKIIAEHVDPIEKKPLYHFLPGTYVYSIGTVGCNFKCSFCQNYDISQFKEFYGKIIGEKITSKEIVEEAIKTKCRSIAYTYNEPTVFIEFAKDTAEIAKKKGLKNIFITNGYMTKEAFNFISPFIDAMNIDLKSFKEDFYIKNCKAKLQPVLETIKRAHKKKISLEITTLVIPEENDSEEELKQIAEFIASVNKNIPWHISRFFPAYRMSDRNPTSIEILKKAEKIGKNAGLKYVHIGNI
jgi:pyruvate formate lyase activating enzyme